MCESESFSDGFSSKVVGCETEEQMTSTNGRRMSGIKTDQEQDSSQGELNDCDYLGVGPIEPSNVDTKNRDGLIISGFDVEQLYPSLRDIDVACLVRESLIHSKIEFEGFDYENCGG